MGGGVGEQSVQSEKHLYLSALAQAHGGHSLRHTTLNLLDNY